MAATGFSALGQSGADAPTSVEKECIVTAVNTASVGESLRAGLTAAKAGHKAEARRLLREVADAEPLNELAWLWLAGVAETPRDALISLQRVLEINPDNPQALQGLTTTRLQLGIAEAKAGRKRTARRYLLEVTQKQPHNELAWLWLGGVAESPDNAIACLERVLELNPANQHARQGLQTMRLEAGIADARVGNKESARRHLLAVTTQDPGNAMAWHWRAEVAESPGEAVRCLEQVLELDLGNAEALEMYCWYQLRTDFRTGEWRCPFCQKGGMALADGCPACGAILSIDNTEAFSAKRPFRADQVEATIRKLETQGKDYPTHYRLGLGYLNLNQHPQAIAHFEAALRFVPENRKLEQQIKMLLERQSAVERRAREERAQQGCILVVDDSPTVRKLVTLTLEKQGYRVVAAADAAEAQQCFTIEVPDLVLLDITMPGMDGYELCRIIKAGPQTGHVPVIMLSGHDGFFDKIRGRIAGSTEYITKPFKPESLIQIARKHCLKKSASPSRFGMETHS
jgi:twitching motility two-component system response regulator PilG